MHGTAFLLDLSGILDLFDYDAVVYEPFSNITGGLNGRSSIEPFLKVAMMANSTLRRTIIIEKPTTPNKVTALIIFEKGDKVKAKFTFEFTNGNSGEKTIRSLHIEFLGSMSLQRLCIAKNMQTSATYL